MEKFVYLPESNALLNLSLVSMVRFSGAAESPTCIVHFGCGSASLELEGGDIARLMEILQVDLQAVQVDLQRTHSGDSRTSQKQKSWRP
jgi:hypothetical protein